MKLYIDDIREAPDESWTLVRTISEAIRFIARYDEKITHISLDHDISVEVRIDGEYRPFPSAETYQPVAYFLGERYGSVNSEMYIWRPEIIIHSSNPKGSEEMQHILSDCGVACRLEPMGAAFRKK